MSSLHDPQLEKLFKEDREILKETQLPIVTVAGTFQEDLKDWHGEKNSNRSADIVFSRAHFSMAYGVVKSIWGKAPQPEKAWLVDPTNYVLQKNWKNIQFTETVGKIIARTPALKMVKDVIDQYGRKKLPILDSITPPLLYLFEEVNQPILSFHIAAGSILAKMGKTVVQVITDPHVRDEYVEAATSPSIYFCVFDERTKVDMLERASILGIELDHERIIITGPPVDPRIIEMRAKKTFTPHAPLRLLITTGGLGTNKAEIQSILDQLLPELKKKNSRYQVMLYAGTQADFVDMAKEIAEQHRIKCSTVSSPTFHIPDSTFSILHHPQIYDANELLMTFGFPWADGIISKPSGDMAYDTAVAGCFLLTLKPWGIWEERISDIFEQKGISRPAEADHIVKQLEALSYEFNTQQSWIDLALQNTKKLPNQYLHGVKEIIAVVKMIR